MKRIKPTKIVWVKRININNQTFDFITMDEIKANSIIESTKDRIIGSKFGKAGFYYTYKFKIIKGLKSGWIRDITLVIITILLSYFIPKILK